MSAISRDDVAHLASLSRIAMSEQELEKLAGELELIVDSIKSVSEVASADVPPTSHPIPLKNVLREDVPGQTLSNDEALAGAPESAAGQFKVPAILGED